ncbi:hypothetical protein S245_021827 [Arachis hypogaea]
MWDPAADLIGTGANDGGENKGTLVTADIFLNDCNKDNLIVLKRQRMSNQYELKGINNDADLGGFDECGSERTVTQICIEKRSGTKQDEKRMHGEVEINGCLQRREAHKAIQNAGHLLGHSTTGPQEVYWSEGLLCGIQQLQICGLQGKLNGASLQKRAGREERLGNEPPVETGPGKHNGVRKESETGNKDGLGQALPRGSGSKEPGRENQQYQRDSDPGLSVPCAAGSRNVEAIHVGDAVHETGCTTLPRGDEVDNRGVFPACASMREASERPGITDDWTGERTEERGRVEALCADEGSEGRVVRRRPVAVDAEPEEDSLTKEGTSRSEQGYQLLLCQIKVCELEEREDEGVGQGNVKDCNNEDAGSETELEHAPPDDEQRDTQAKQLVENKETLKLAVESGAVFYDDEEDLMAILQSQNEVIAAKRKMAKQREKARRSRPKQHNKRKKKGKEKNTRP